MILASLFSCENFSKLPYNSGTKRVKLLLDNCFSHSYLWKYHLMLRCACSACHKRPSNMKSAWAEPIGGFWSSHPSVYSSTSIQLNFSIVYEHLVQVIIMKCCSHLFRYCCHWLSKPQRYLWWVYLGWLAQFEEYYLWVLRHDTQRYYDIFFIENGDPIIFY